ncbi:unnamed protein product, partial [Lepidochelys olivacea]
MASGQWQALAQQFQVICPPPGKAPGAGSPGGLRGQVSCGHRVSTAGLRGWVRALLDQCPRSQHLVQRLDPDTLRTPCLPCSQRAEGLYCFCWGCRMDWKDPLPQGKSCSNPQCPLQAVLYDTPEIQAPGSSVHGCPSLQACPQCHTLVSHTGLGCPLVVCPECCMEFCYRCLRDHLGDDTDETEWEHGED